MAPDIGIQIGYLSRYFGEFGDKMKVPEGAGITVLMLIGAEIFLELFRNRRD